MSDPKPPPPLSIPVVNGVPDLSHVLDVANRLEQQVQQISAKRSSWSVLLVLLATTPLGMQVVEWFKAPDPPPPAATSADVASLRSDLASIRLSMGDNHKDLSTRLKSVEEKVIRLEVIREERDRPR